MDYTLTIASKCRFSSYLNIHGLWTGPGKLFMGVLESPGFFCQWKSGNLVMSFFGKHRPHNKKQSVRFLQWSRCKNLFLLSVTLWRNMTVKWHSAVINVTITGNACHKVRLSLLSTKTAQKLHISNYFSNKNSIVTIMCNHCSDLHCVVCKINWCHLTAVWTTVWKKNPSCGVYVKASEWMGRI